MKICSLPEARAFAASIDLARLPELLVLPAVGNGEVALCAAPEEIQRLVCTAEVLNNHVGDLEKKVGIYNSHKLFPELTQTVREMVELSAMLTAEAAHRGWVHAANGPADVASRLKPGSRIQFRTGFMMVAVLQEEEPLLLDDVVPVAPPAASANASTAVSPAHGRPAATSSRPAPQGALVARSGERAGPTATTPVKPVRDPELAKMAENLERLAKEGRAAA